MLKASARVLLFIFGPLVLFAKSASADSWKVVAIRSPATIATASGSWIPLSLGATVPDGSWVSTGGGGRLTLGRERDVIQVRPGSVASISSPLAQGSMVAVVRQKFGRLLFDIEPGSDHGFRVETPFLTAVVKGTEFNVSVSREQARLTVEKGEVEAIDVVAGFSATVLQGQTVLLDATTPASLVLSGPGPKVVLVEVAPTRPTVAPAITPEEAQILAAEAGTTDPTTSETTTETSEPISEAMPVTPPSAPASVPEPDEDSGPIASSDLLPEDEPLPLEPGNPDSEAGSPDNVDE